MVDIEEVKKLKLVEDFLKEREDKKFTEILRLLSQVIAKIKEEGITKKEFASLSMLLEQVVKELKGIKDKPEVQFPEITIPEPLGEVRVSNLDELPKPEVKVEQKEIKIPEYPKEIRVSNLGEVPKPEIRLEQKEVKIPEYPKEIKVSNLKDIPAPEIKTEKVEFPETLKKLPELLFIKLKQLLKIPQVIKLSHRHPDEYIPVRLSNGKIFYESLGGSGGVAGGPAVPTTWESGSKDVTTAGLPEALASDTKCQSVIVQAKSTNTGTIKVGGLASAPVFELAKNEQVAGDIDNLNKIRIDATINGEGVNYLYIW